MDERTTVRRSRDLALAALVTALSAGLCAPTAEAQDYPHGDTGQPLDCTQCHTMEGWKPLKDPIEFDHEARTDFARSGRHAEVWCTRCHLTLRFGELRLPATECGSCHVDVHLGNLSNECVACHNTSSFNDVPGGSLHTRTSLPLTGSHLQISCESCHADDTGGAYTTLNPDCAACHLDDYENAVSLDHVAAGFPTDCRACHNTLAFGGGIFDHLAVSGGFELRGAHARIPCESCHIVPGFEPIYPGVTDRDCFECHQEDYEPEHGGSDFPTECTLCHNTEDFGEADFDHTLVGFPLEGIHQQLDCSACHRQPGNEPIFNPSGPDDCVACHLDDYSGEHGASGFPTDCTLCHTPTRWTDATFLDHDVLFFPVNSGKHRGRWSGCQTCHTIPDDFSTFTCFECHQHEKSRMDDKHADEPGYVYDSRVCIQCHPDGRAP